MRVTAGCWIPSEVKDHVVFILGCGAEGRLSGRSTRRRLLACAARSAVDVQRQRTMGIFHCTQFFSGSAINTLTQTSEAQKEPRWKGQVGRLIQSRSYGPLVWAPGSESLYLHCNIFNHHEKQGPILQIPANNQSPGSFSGES